MALDPWKAAERDYKRLQSDGVRVPHKYHGIAIALRGIIAALLAIANAIRERR